MELQEMKEQLIEWMNKMKYGYRDPELYMYECEGHKKEEKGIRIKIFTNDNYYSIIAYPPNNEDYKGYLGCMGGSRKPRTGEDWSRGNDLADGKFSKETWIEILSDIIGYELVKIHRPIKYLYEEKEEVIYDGPLIIGPDKE